MSRVVPEINIEITVSSKEDIKNLI